MTPAEAREENLATAALLAYTERHPAGEERMDPDPLAEVRRVLLADGRLIV